MLFSIICLIGWCIDFDTLVAWILWYDALLCDLQGSFTSCYLVVAFLCSSVPVQFISVLALSYFCLASGCLKAYGLSLYNSIDCSGCCQRCSVVYLTCIRCVDGHWSLRDLNHSVNLGDLQILRDIFTLCIHDYQLICCRCHSGLWCHICCCCIRFRFFHLISFWQTCYFDSCSMCFSIINMSLTCCCYYNFLRTLCYCKGSYFSLLEFVVILLSTSVPFQLIGVLTASYYCLASCCLKVYSLAFNQSCDFSTCCQRIAIIRLAGCLCLYRILSCQDLVASHYASFVVSDTCDCYFDCSGYICVIRLVVTYCVVSSFYKYLFSIFYSRCPFVLYTVIRAIRWRINFTYINVFP